MAISLDATSNYNTNLGNIGGGNPGSVSWSHTCTGSNLILIVGIGLQGATGAANFISVTYNGVAMTRLNTNGTVALYYLINPATGAHNITASVDDSGSKPFAGFGASYAGAKQTGFPDSSAIPTGTGTTYSPATTVVGAGCWLVAIAGTTNNNNQLTASSGTSARAACWNNGNTNSYVLGDSSTNVGPGSQTLSFVADASASWQAIILSMLPVTPPVVNSNFLSLF